MAEGLAIMVQLEDPSARLGRNIVGAPATLEHCELLLCQATVKSVRVDRKPER